MQNLFYYLRITLQLILLYSHSSRRAILQNDDVRPGAPLSNLLVNDFWGTPLSHSGSHKSFRPLTTATFRLNYALSRAHPRSYHLLNVALHALATYLFVLYARYDLISHFEMESNQNSAKSDPNLEQ